MIRNNHDPQISGISVPEAIPIACSLSDSELAARSELVRQNLLGGVEERRELEDGYAFRFPGNGDWHVRLADFVGMERQCCSFFRIGLTFEPGLGPIWLTLTGAAGTKAFVEQTFVTSRES